MEDQEECKFWEGTAGDDLAIPVQLTDGQRAPVKIGTGDGMTDIVGEFTTSDGGLFQTKYSAAPGVTLVDSTCGRALINVPAASSLTLRTSKTRKQIFTVYAVINGKKQTWEFNILLNPRPVPAT